MRVITENDIIVQKGTRTEGFYSAANGKKNRDIAGKAKNFVQSGGVQNLLDSLQGGRNQPGPVNVSPAPAPAPAPTKKGLSTGAKIGIAVGVVAILGIGYYLYTKKKGK